MRVGDFELRDSQLRGTNSYEGMLLASAGDFMVQAPAENVLDLSGGEVRLHSHTDVLIESARGEVELRAGYDEDVDFDVKGGALVVGSLHLDGSALRGTDQVQGLSMRSPAELKIHTKAQGRIHMRSGGDLTVIAAHGVGLYAENIVLGTGLNSNVYAALQGGSVRMGQMQFGARGIDAIDAVKGIQVQAERGVRIQAGEVGGLQAVTMVGRAIHMTAADVMLGGAEVKLHTKWNGMIDLDANGGDVRLGGALVADGGMLRSQDPARALR